MTDNIICYQADVDNLIFYDILNEVEKGKLEIEEGIETFAMNEKYVFTNDLMNVSRLYTLHDFKVQAVYSDTDCSIELLMNSKYIAIYDDDSGSTIILQIENLTV